MCPATAQQLVPLLRGDVLRAIAAAHVDSTPLQGRRGQLERRPGAGLFHHHRHRHLGLRAAPGVGTVTCSTPRSDTVECLRPGARGQRRRVHHHFGLLPGLRQRRGRLQHVVKMDDVPAALPRVCAGVNSWCTLYIVCNKIALPPSCPASCLLLGQANIA